MRIAHITATFPPYFSGTGYVCYYNALELAKRGHHVTVFTSDNHFNSYLNPSEIKVNRLSYLFRFGNAPFLPGLYNVKDFDIIHLHHPFIFGSEMIWMISKFRNIPFVITHHNDLIGTGLRKYLFNFYSFISHNFIVGGAKKVIAVSSDHIKYSCLRPILINRLSDVVEVPNGVDINIFHPGVDGSIMRSQLGLSEEEKVILFVGALDRAHYFKSVDYLLEVFSKLETPGTVLVIVGDGELRAHYMDYAEQLGVSRRTYFIGRVPTHEQLPSYYAMSDFVVLPSKPPESFGMVLIEAMACARPVIAHDIPGVRDVVANGIDGFLVSPGDTPDLIAKIQMLLDDSSARRNMGVQGRAKVEKKYSWGRIAELLEDVYTSVLEDRH